MRKCLGSLALVMLCGTARAEEAPDRWEKLFFPFPIVGAPPQLEQQVQLFSSTFHGNQGSGEVPSFELAAIVSPHWGLVLSAPYQFGFGGQNSGVGDVQLSAQYLVGGSLAADNILAAGVLTSFPTAQHGLGTGDYYVGPFAYAAQRFWQHLILEANFTALVPVAHGESTRQLLGTALLSVLVTPARFDYPLYVQAEVNGTTFLGGTAALPPGATSSPAQTVFIAPEIFVGPFRWWLNDGTRLAVGVFFNLHGDPVHAQTYSFTVAFDIPNRYGY